jgi:EryCIII-like glycosyltransferase
MTSVPASMVRRVVRGVAASGAHVIVAGTVHDLGDLEGPRVTVGGVLPSQKIMPRVDLAVTTGGQGSVQCAMAAGTPLIGIPLHWEQDANVHFLEQRGAARLLPIGEIEDRKLGALVREMLNGPCFREAARRIQTIYAGYDGPALVPRRSWNASIAPTQSAPLEDPCKPMPSDKSSAIPMVSHPISRAAYFRCWPLRNLRRAVRLHCDCGAQRSSGRSRPKHQLMSTRPRRQPASPPARPWRLDARRATRSARR